MNIPPWIGPLLMVLAGALGGNAGSWYVSLYGAPVANVREERSASEWRERHLVRVVGRATELYRSERDFSCIAALERARVCLNGGSDVVEP